MHKCFNRHMHVRAILLLSLFLPCAFATDQPTFNSGLDPSVGATAIVTDAAGNTYITGYGIEPKLTPTPGAFQTQPHRDQFCGTVQMIGAPIPCSESFV